MDDNLLLFIKERLDSIEKKIDTLQLQSNQITKLETEIVFLSEMRPKIERLEQDRWKKIGAQSVISAVVAFLTMIIFKR